MKPRGDGEEKHVTWEERNVKIKMCLSGKLQEMFL